MRVHSNLMIAHQDLPKPRRLYTFQPSNLAGQSTFEAPEPPLPLDAIRMQVQVLSSDCCPQSLQPWSLALEKVQCHVGKAVLIVIGYACYQITRRVQENGKGISNPPRQNFSKTEQPRQESTPLNNQLGNQCERCKDPIPCCN